MHERSNALLFSFSTKAQEGFTFANTLGVNFKKIVLSGAANTFDGKESTGWVINEDKSTITWEGDAASVSIWETLDIVGPVKVNEVEFTLEGGEPEPEPTVWTALKVGDVIKVGDQLSPSVEWESANDYGVIKPDWAPYTLLRANIAQEHEWDDPVVTEAEDGAYYVFKFTHPTSGTCYLLANSAKSPLLAATATSDGLEVTNVGDDYGTPAFTFAVHENGSDPTAVENVQGNVRATKVIENGVLYIMYNGIMYNVQGTRVR